MELYKKLSPSQEEYLNNEIDHLTPNDFLSVLRYYNIEVQGNSILCPFHHDKHHNSCNFLPDKKTAYCHSCKKLFDSIEVVREKESIGYMDAKEFIWCSILGNRLPEAEDRKVGPPITIKDMRFIGLKGCCGEDIILPYNICDKSEDIADRRFGAGALQKDGTYLVAESKSFPSLSKLYNSPPHKKLVMSLLIAKAKETIEYYTALKESINDKDSPLGRLMTDEVTLKKSVLKINENLKRANEILKKLKEA